MDLLREVLDSGRWGGHSDFVKRFEHEFARSPSVRTGFGDEWHRDAGDGAERGVDRPRR